MLNLPFECFFNEHINVIKPAAEKNDKTITNLLIPIAICE